MQPPNEDRGRIPRPPPQAIPPSSSASDQANHMFRPLMMWAGDVEELLVHWSEEARCMQWMHVQAHRMYRRKYHNLIIPIIVLSTVTGAVNIGMASFVPAAAILYSQVGIGLLNLSVGIMTTLLNFFSYAQKTQAHLATAGMWFKLYRRISTELAIHSENRSHASDFFDSVKKEYEVICEQAPELEAETLREFKKKFAEQMRVRHNLDQRDIDHLSAYFDSSAVSSPGQAHRDVDEAASESVSVAHSLGDREDGGGIYSQQGYGDSSEPAILDSIRSHRLRARGGLGARGPMVLHANRGPEVHVPMIAQPFMPTPIYQNHIREYRERRHAHHRPYFVTEMMVATLTPTPSIGTNMSSAPSSASASASVSVSVSASAPVPAEAGTSSASGSEYERGTRMSESR